MKPNFSLQTLSVVSKNVLWCELQIKNLSFSEDVNKNIISNIDKKLKIWNQKV